jgi:hypothetical protein
MKLKKTPWINDPRSNKFDNDTLFGTINPFKLPLTLDRPRAPVFDQGNTTRCTGYGSAANGFYIHGEVMNPDWHAAMIGKKQGRSVDESGGDPNATMKHMRDDGFLKMSVCPRKWQENSVPGTGWLTWEHDLAVEALKLDNISGFVKISAKSQDYFDSIHSALVQAYDPVTKRGPVVDAFSSWRPGYNLSTVEFTGEIIGYHRYIFVDTEKTYKGLYLVSQNSYGEEFGDKGFQYWDRPTINREFSQRGTSLKQLKLITPEMLAELKREGPLASFVRAVINAWSIFSDRL